MSNEIELEKIRNEHQWLLMPINSAVAHVEKLPFFDWLKNIESPQAFKPVASQIFHHSSTLPKAIGMMLAATPVRRGTLYSVYAEHAHEEADHHLLLLDWMLRNKIITDTNEVYNGEPTLETSACINMGYEFALVGDHDGWLAVINSAVELCFWNFFKVTSRRMHQIGTPHKYFDVHVVADENHSTMGLKYLNGALNMNERRRLIRKALDGISLWTAMVHSWVGIQNLPRFDENGVVKFD